MNEQTRQRFQEWCKEMDLIFDCQCEACLEQNAYIIAAWNAQNEYWSKRCEEMEKALRSIEAATDLETARRRAFKALDKLNAMKSNL